MTADELARSCDELHAYIDRGPGEDPGVFAASLGIVRRLRASASWDYPMALLTRIETRLASWFSPDKWRGDDEGLCCRLDLLSDISTLEDAWERPRT
jgi:hypothetical protein